MCFNSENILLSETMANFMVEFTLYLPIPLSPGSFFPSSLPSSSVPSSLYVRNTNMGLDHVLTLWYLTYTWPLQWCQWFSCISLVCIRLQKVFARHHVPLFTGEKIVEAEQYLSYQEDHVDGNEPKRTNLRSFRSKSLLFQSIVSHVPYTEHVILSRHKC